MSDLGARDVVRVVGPEAETYLQGQLTQDVAAIAPGDSAWSFLLQPQGKVDALVRVTRVGADEFTLDVDAGSGPTVVARLQRFKLRTKADIALVEEHAEGAGRDDASERARIERGWPAMGAELDERTIPGETGLVPETVSFTKGCYTGQELVARIDARGNNVPRHLRILRASSGVIEQGAAVVVDAREVGTVTSSVGDVALAYVGRAVEPPATGRAGGAEVSIEAVPR